MPKEGTKQQFGGDWTSEKLERVRKYLVAYATIMNALRKQGRGFRFAYIDAFAGTGYNTPKEIDDEFAPFFEGLHSEESRQFLEGSAQVALKVEPQFDQYIFIERSPARYRELIQLGDKFPNLKGKLEFKNTEATSYLDELCLKRNWNNRRAVLFLDPFGMQVTWKTITAIAKTGAIDLWLLFPLGTGANRLLTRNGVIPNSWRTRLDATFGATDWFDEFYKQTEQYELLSDLPVIETRKVANFDAISRYFLKRLKTVFPHVAKNPLPLLNSSNCPLYLLYFAAGNPGNGGKIAVRIAENILKP